MRWLKKQVKANDGSPLDIWVDDTGSYTISQNVNQGRFGPNGSAGGWWFTITRSDLKANEVHVGDAPTLKSAKYVAEDDAEGND